MSAAEVRAEAARFGLPPDDDVEVLRRTLKAELDRRWQVINAEGIAAFNRWFEKNGLPFEDLRVR